MAEEEKPQEEAPAEAPAEGEEAPAEESEGGGEGGGGDGGANKKGVLLFFVTNFAASIGSPEAKTLRGRCACLNSSLGVCPKLHIWSLYASL